MKKLCLVSALFLMCCFCFCGCEDEGTVQWKEASTEKRTEIIKEKTSQKTTATQKKEILTEEKINNLKIKEKKIKIAIDAGHQKEQMTKEESIGPGSSVTKPMVSSGTEGVVTGIPEYQVNLEVSLKLKKMLIARGYDVYMIRETNNVSLSNKERSLMANESDSGIFIRIHCNSADSSSAYGALTMCPSETNPYCKEIAEKSICLAKDVGSGLCSRTGAKNRGIIKTDQMTGINWSKIPVTIVEMGFMSNPEEDQKLCSGRYQAHLAEGIADGIDRYYQREGGKE